jgi:mannose-6-phosphate isomerase-like protein (cupin superfamily)
MKQILTTGRPNKFDILFSTRGAQAATMTLKRGATSDDELSNEHPRCEQWLYVISGSGTATIATTIRKRTVRLKTGSLLTIEKGERHQIRNTGTRPLRTLNIYVPPAYTSRGEVKKSAKSSRKLTVGAMLDKALETVAG